MTVLMAAVTLAVTVGGAALRLLLLAVTALVLAASLTAPLWRPRPVIVRPDQGGPPPV